MVINLDITWADMQSKCVCNQWKCQLSADTRCGHPASYAHTALF